MDVLAGEARRRAFGWEEPLIYAGRRCYEIMRNGRRRMLTIKKYSDVLLMFLLKAARPEIYRDGYWRAEVKHAAVISHGPDLSALCDAEFVELQRLIEEATALIEAANARRESEKVLSLTGGLQQ